MTVYFMNFILFGCVNIFGYNGLGSYANKVGLVFGWDAGDLEETF